MAKKTKKEEISENGSGKEFDFQALAAKVGGEVLDRNDTVQYWIDTGNLALNYCCSGKYIGGGIPIGKIIELWGNSSSCKTLFALNFLRGVQRINGISVFVDVENTLNAQFAEKAAKVDTSKLIVIPVEKADTLQKAFNQIHIIIREIESLYGKDRPVVIVYDSIAASATEREFAETTIDMFKTSKEAKKEAGAGADKPGEHAKTIGKELRKLNPILNRTNTSIIIINQIREKIGVMFGCFSGASKVLLANGKWMKIGKIVKDKLPLEVMSYNPVNGKIEPKKIIGWHDNGRTKDGEFIKIKFRRHFSKGFGYLMVTRNHSIFTTDVNGDIKEVQAGDINVGDTINVVQPFYLSNDQKQLVYGSIMGDGSLRRTSKDGRNVQLRLGHGINQSDYLIFKTSILGKLAGKIGTDGGNKVYMDSKPLYELNELASYKDNYYIPQEVADNMNELGLAIWYLDDGNYSGSHEQWGNGKSNICCKKFKNREIMFSVFERLGLNPSLNEVGFIFNSEDTLKLHRIISRFVPPSMFYKIHPSLRGLFDYENNETNTVDYKSVPSKVISIEDYNSPINRHKYDLTIEDNATYVVGGAIVHNSNETKASGGRSLEYYCSLSLKTKAYKKLKDERENIKGVLVTVENTKNKCFRPFVKAPEDAQLLFDYGIDPVGGLLDCLYKQYRIDDIKGKKSYWRIRPEYSSTGEEAFFQAAVGKNVVPTEVLIEHPKLIDAESSEQVKTYLESFNVMSSDGLKAHEISEGEEIDMGFDG